MDNINSGFIVAIVLVLLIFSLYVSHISTRVNVEDFTIQGSHLEPNLNATLKSRIQYVQISVADQTNLYTNTRYADNNNVEIPFAEQWKLYTNTTHIFYNRVPKCGSTSFMSVLKKTAKKNRFNYFYDYPHPVSFHYNSSTEIEKFVSGFYKKATPLLYNTHLHFVNFTRYNISKLGLKHEPYTAPVYINLIRDPVDRMVSWYYFIRFKNKRVMSDERRNMTFDECVISNNSECLDDNMIFQQVPFFCGNQPKCRKPTTETLETAIKNVIQSYTVVGILEQIDIFYKLLEYTMPEYFIGIYNIFTQKRKDVKMKGEGKKPISGRTRNIMEQRLSMEYEFYNFIKSRLKTQLADLNNNLSTQTSMDGIRNMKGW